jgi:hypothetical protein
VAEIGQRRTRRALARWSKRLRMSPRSLPRARRDPDGSAANRTILFPSCRPSRSHRCGRGCGTRVTRSFAEPLDGDRWRGGCHRLP